MLLKMKYLLFVVIFFTLAMHAAESAKRKKRSVTHQKDKQQWEKTGRALPQDVMVESKFQGGKKQWKELQLDENKIVKQAKESKWREQIPPDAKGKQQHGKTRIEHVQSSVMDIRKVNAKPKKSEEHKCESSEKLSQERVISEDKPKQNKGSFQQMESSTKEEDNEEEIKMALDSVEVCVASKSGAKVSQNSAIKAKESILVQEDIDGKCYYEL